MNKIIVILFMALAVGFAQGSVVVTEVMTSSNHDNGDTNDNGDWFELANVGDTAVSLSGWTWVDDNTGHDKLAFPDITLAAGQVIICLDESSADDWLSTWGLANSGLVVVTNDDFGDFNGLGGSDGVFLYDGTDTLVDSFTWESSNDGISLDAYNGGESQVGVNGAWASVDVDGGSDIASPGVVPEPATFALMAVGAMVFKRRK